MVEIFGVLDPAGPDPARLRGLVDNAGEVRGRGPVAMGVLGHPDERSSVFESADGLLVADARLDAHRVDGAWGPVEGDDLATLEAVLATHGPRGLAGLAADFALARFDAREEVLLLSRDAFGVRPLFWARQGMGFGFASRPQTLIQMGFASGDLAVEPTANYLALRGWGGEHTGFEGVDRVLGGRWVAVDAAGTHRRGRWFRPEDVREEPWSLEDAVARLRSSLEAAITSRARDRRVGIFLSGGRDSGTIALAAAEAGVDAVCITSTFPESDLSSEAEGARALAESAGQPWVGVPAPLRATRQHVADLRDGDSPLPFFFFAQASSLCQAAAEQGARVVLDGQGGDDLFSGAPVVCLDLIRARRWRTAVRALRSYVHLDDQRYSHSEILRSLLWAILPGKRLGTIRLRRRQRTQPPWLRLPLSEPPIERSLRSNRAAMVRELLRWGGDPEMELWARLLRSRGTEYSPPLFDQRVVEIGLALPAHLQAPLSGRKPVLRHAFLGELDASRMKVTPLPSYYERFAASLARDFPTLCPGTPEIVSRGIVKGSPGLDILFQPESRLAAGRAVALELWLREERLAEPRLAELGSSEERNAIGARRGRDWNR